MAGELITPITRANFASNVAFVMPNVMPVAVTHGILGGSAAISFGDPNKNTQAPLPTLVELPFRFGQTPKHMMEPGEYLVTNFSEELPQTDFQMTFEILLPPAGKVNYELASMARYIAREAPDAERGELITEAASHVSTLQHSHAYLKLGFFMMCLADHDMRLKVEDLLMHAAELLMQHNSYSAAAIAFELIAENFEFHASQIEGTPEKIIELQERVSKARAMAGGAWRASTNVDNDRKNTKLRLYRGIYNAWHNPDRTDIAGLMNRTAIVRRNRGELNDAADDYMRFAYFASQKPGVDGITWSKTADAILTALTVWMEMGQMDNFAPAQQLINAAHGFTE